MEATYPFDGQISSLFRHSFELFCYVGKKWKNPTQSNEKLTIQIVLLQIQNQLEESQINYYFFEFKMGKQRNKASFDTKLNDTLNNECCSREEKNLVCLTYTHSRVFSTTGPAQLVTSSYS